MDTKIGRVRALMAAGDEVGALRLVVKFPRLGAEKVVIERGWMAHTRPEFVREIGHDPDRLFADAVAAIRAKYGVEPATEVTREHVGWLRTLIGAFREAQARLEDEGHEDEDPTATGEMLTEVGRLADALEARTSHDREPAGPPSTGPADDIPL